MMQAKLKALQNRSGPGNAEVGKKDDESILVEIGCSEVLVLKSNLRRLSENWTWALFGYRQSSMGAHLIKEKLYFFCGKYQQNKLLPVLTALMSD
jgi:hypothetical protein